MLTLRNPLDTATTETKGTRMASLMGAPDAAAGHPRRAGRPPRRRASASRWPRRPPVHLLR